MDHSPINQNFELNKSRQKFHHSLIYSCMNFEGKRSLRNNWERSEDRITPEKVISTTLTFSYPEPILRAVNGARQGALAKSISNWHLIGYNEGYCSNNVYILLPCFYGIRFWIWPEPLVAPRVRRALGTRMQH